MYLDEGVNVRQLAHYYFQGNPAEGEEVVTEFDGPKDESFLVQDTRKDLNLVSSRCGETETLNVRATLRLRNQGRRDGYVNVAAIDSSTKLIFKLCGSAATAETTTRVRSAGQTRTTPSRERRRSSRVGSGRTWSRLNHPSKAFGSSGPGAFRLGATRLRARSLRYLGKKPG